MMEAQVENKSKIGILEVAKHLFWKHVIRRVTVQEICREAGMSKMTFYRYFENKEDVAFQLIQKVLQDSQRRYREILYGSVDFTVKVVELVKMKREGVSGISQELVKNIIENQDEKFQDVINDFREKSLA